MFISQHSILEMLLQIKLQDLIDFVEKYNVNVRPEKIFKIEQIQEAH